ncbi:hypothetical protein DNTS_021598 [Danionella cerebrum]|uniref:Uncharacterized protein n=1 Tax=Danionella cerebrum TaxID=2873325 RepID=A0A553QXK9_9TELE|nr:hypothetical protein DNTS_021598 [Danionella translucida]
MQCVPLQTEVSSAPGSSGGFGYPTSQPVRSRCLRSPGYYKKNMALVHFRAPLQLQRSGFKRTCGDQSMEVTTRRLDQCSSQKHRWRDSLDPCMSLKSKKMSFSSASARSITHMVLLKKYRKSSERTSCSFSSSVSSLGGTKTSDFT